MKRYWKMGLSILTAAALVAGCTPEKQSVKEPSKANEITALQQKYASLPIRTLDKQDKNRVYYEIFVRSFSDSNADGIGDIKGMTQKLDYLNDGDPSTFTDLGITGIWLMPITKSPSYHKYDVTDYYSVDPEYGTLEDFKTFVAEAHKRGISVIMDLVVNHTSSEHPWFKEAQLSKTSQYRSYYEWAGEGPFNPNLEATKWGNSVWHTGIEGSYYGLFWEKMPDLNYNNPKVREEMKSTARFWLEQGVDGFRLDAAMHIFSDTEYPEKTDFTAKNLEWWKEFRAACQQVNPNVYLVGEIWDENPDARAPYFQVFDSGFNFNIGQLVANAVNAGQDSAANAFSSQLADQFKKYQVTNPNFIDAPFLSNHDQNRIMSELRKDRTKAKLAANILMTMPGNPFIYYGEEIGMTGAKPDEMIRLPFKWFDQSKAPQTSWQQSDYTAEVTSMEKQDTDTDSLLTHYKKLTRIRHANQALMKGDFQPIRIDSMQVLAYSRNLKKSDGSQESVLVLHNVGTTATTISLPEGLLSNKKFLFESSGVNENKIDGNNITLTPRASVILK